MHKNAPVVNAGKKMANKTTPKKKDHQCPCVGADNSIQFSSIQFNSIQFNATIDAKSEESKIKRDTRLCNTHNAIQEKEKFQHFATLCTTLHHRPMRSSIRNSTNP